MKKLLPNPSRHTAYMREWRARNVDKRVAYERAYWAAYATEPVREAARVRARAWYQANKDRAKATARRAYHAARDEKMAQIKAWQAANPPAGGS